MFRTVQQLVDHLPRIIVNQFTIFCVYLFELCKNPTTFVIKYVKFRVCIARTCSHLFLHFEYASVHLRIVQLNVKILSSQRTRPLVTRNAHSKSGCCLLQLSVDAVFYQLFCRKTTLTVVTTPTMSVIMAVETHLPFALSLGCRCWLLAVAEPWFVQLYRSDQLFLNIEHAIG